MYQDVLNQEAHVLAKEAIHLNDDVVNLVHVPDSIKYIVMSFAQL